MAATTKGIIILASPLGRTNSGDKLTKEEQARPFAPTSLVPVTGSTLWASARHSSAQSLLSFTVRHCVLARRHDAEAILRQYPTMVGNLPSLDLELLPRYCWETNTNYEAVRLMLDLGFPIAHTESSHGYSPLHNAAWSGDSALVDLLISRGHSVDLVDPRYNSTPLDYAIHDCIVEKRHPEGDFARVVELLLKAGSPWQPSMYPTGDQRVDEVLGRFR